MPHISAEPVLKK